MSVNSPLSPDLERAAAKGEPAPDGLSAPQLRLYITLRGIYHDYRAGIISKSEAVREKDMAVKLCRADRMDVFVNTIKDTAESRRRYHLAAAAGDGPDHLLELAKEIIRQATGDGTF